MSHHVLPKLVATSLAASALIGSGPSEVWVQTLSQTNKTDSRALQIDGVVGEQTSTGSARVPHSGKIMFPGDHFTQAFPGDHFSPRQQRALTSQGITTLADFMAANPSVIGRLVGESPHAVSQWQQDIKTRLR
ncbi:hypothetical protein [Roseinatronobacter alkalisoli]|uniref:Uncharacterized protein n=1 Tax=Roseinatronobacter alkalisoli TaxID=3028235 RepID=A0ABT5TDN9_9RHOB|nr:hypothetical protein [Roseinatronobacter sp. HJB301]MDD7973229.1 hypothetical protein [Roseinatronobacter sp. HJB301]